MNQYAEENDERFANPETFEYLETFHEHCDKIIEACEEALKCFRQSINENFPHLCLAFNIREYLDREERIKIFTLVNSKDVSAEYAEHIDEFN